VSVLGFGAAPLGDLYARLDEATAVSAVEAAIARGVTLIDTSPLYGHGMSELRVGSALRRAGVPGIAISTTITRLSVEVVSATTAPSALWTSPKRAMPNQPKGLCVGWVMHVLQAESRRQWH
jgi:aryl-alcohol dehydrogenase-like predicted oxidoreductase